MEPSLPVPVRLRIGGFDRPITFWISTRHFHFRFFLSYGLDIMQIGRTYLDTPRSGPSLVRTTPIMSIGKIPRAAGRLQTPCRPFTGTGSIRLQSRNTHSHLRIPHQATPIGYGLHITTIGRTPERPAAVQINETVVGILLHRLFHSRERPNSSIFVIGNERSLY